TGRIGPAANYAIRARDQATGLFYDVPFTHQMRTADGYENAVFGTAQSNAAVVTDQLMILLTDRETGIDHYGIREVRARNGSEPVPMRLPKALSELSWGGYYPVARAFDGTTGAQWSSDTQGGVMAIYAAGRNMKFTNLRIIGFGTKAAR